MQKGGAWEEKDFKPAPLPLKFSPFSFPAADAGAAAGSVQLIAYPTIQFFDGRSANRPWLQELPDPLTMITWGSWLEIHPETAKKMGIERGDFLQVQSPHGSVEVPAYPYYGVHPDIVAMPVGQGHTAYGQFADSQTGNPVQLLAPDSDRASGGMLWSVSGITLKKQNKTIPLANTDGSLSQHNRELAQAVSWESFARARAVGKKPHLRLPLPEGYDPAIDFYAPHEHHEYRWCMAVDLDRCIGCGACVVACSAENNVAVVGREQVIRGREMSWLRVQRYFEVEQPTARFLPMLCQHCDSAPCESVCPVYAPHHSAEGLNNQIYNRCIGTRFCSQNCPYKVRRFNFFTYTRPEPLNWQLNPDVTVRERGVMEKCSFCVQRIKEVKNRARDENRKIKDGEVKPACVQTCPADALIFGNLLDPESRVAAAVKDPRAYQVLGHLNTKPAVIYLKKVINTVKA
jgi:molybdopterin-containing oxidoreductase family iron-sulfur binding subunit